MLTLLLALLWSPPTLEGHIALISYEIHHYVLILSAENSSTEWQQYESDSKHQNNELREAKTLDKTKRDPVVVGQHSHP